MLFIAHEHYRILLLLFFYRVLLLLLLLHFLYIVPYTSSDLKLKIKNN